MPGRKQHDQRYIQHLIIRIFLYVRERSVAGKRIRRLLEIRVSYSEIAKKLHIKAMNMQTKAFCATVGLPFSRKFEDVLKDQKTRQTSLQAASYIAYACSNALGPDSKHRAARAVQVEMLVHSKQLHRFRRGTDGLVNLSTPRWSISKQSPSALVGKNSLPRTKPSSKSKPRRRERSPSTAKDIWRFISLGRGRGGQGWAAQGLHQGSPRRRRRAVSSGRSPWRVVWRLLKRRRERRAAARCRPCRARRRRA